MNMFRAFMELAEAYNDRQSLIDEIKRSGKNYNFDKYTDAQLYRMAQRIRQSKVAAKEPAHELDLDFDVLEPSYCDCGTRLTDLGQCSVCDFGEEDLDEDLQYCWFGYYLDKDGKKKVIYATKDSTSHDPDEGAEKLEGLIPEPYTKFVFRGNIENLTAEREGWTLVEDSFDGKPASRSSWVSASGKPVTLSNSTPASTSTTSQTQPSVNNEKYIVRIVSDKGRLRALATDGIHPGAWVAFPNSLRQFEGQEYEVDQLIWNGKNYRVAGNIVEI